MNRPQSAPSREARQQGPKMVVGQGVEGARAEYRPRAKAPQAGAAQQPSRAVAATHSSPKQAAHHGAEPAKQRASSAARKRREVVNEYMRVHVDPVMGDVITALLLTQPADVPTAMLEYLRALRDHGTPPVDADASRKVSRTDRVYMVQRISPVLTDLLGDVVKARPRAPVDFMIAWLASKAVRSPTKGTKQPPAKNKPLPLEPLSDNVAPSPKASVRSKLREAVSLDAHVQQDQLKVPPDAQPHPPPSVVAALTPTRSPSEARDDHGAASSSSSAAKDAPPKQQQQQQPVVEAEVAAAKKEPIKKKMILMLGNTGVGKTTMLKALGGDMEPSCRPSNGFRKNEFPHADESGNADGTTLSFCDVSGRPVARKAYYANYGDVHAVVFVVDASEDLAAAREAFDDAFRPAATAVHEDVRRAMLRGKPLLVVANKQDASNAAAPDDVATALDLASLQRDLEDEGKALDVAVCAAIANPIHNGNALDDRIEKAVEWLVARVDEDPEALTQRIAQDQVVLERVNADKLRKKEERVFRKTLRKAWPTKPDAEPEECMTKEEGLEFFCAELGATQADLEPVAVELAATVNYQKLALTMMANMKAPVNVKKRAPMDWPAIVDWVHVRKSEAWDPQVLEQDEIDDPMSERNRAAKIAARIAEAEAKKLKQQQEAGAA